MEKNGDETVFPHDIGMGEFGLTKREYFAAMAMQGILSSCFASMNPAYEHAAQDAVNFADALLKELNKSV